MRMGLVLRFASWAVAGVLAMVFLTLPVSVHTQFILALSVIAGMVVIWVFFKGPFARQAFLALGSFVVIRYIYWRTTSTLPPVADTTGFVIGLMLLLAELYCLLILVISLIINADPLKRKPLEQEPDDKLPTVDVFIPSYNEDEYILATTMAAARSMDYPAHKLTVWLLDDGGTDQKCNDKNPEKAAAAWRRRMALQKLCAEMGCRYLTRARNEHAKAGNMNNALKHSTGEVIVVFDADHAPFRAFLRETVGHFLLDPKLFLVQTPHVFLNPDPIEKNLRTFDRMPSENEMFYSVTQRGLDKWNGSFFCGSAALLRRAALETTGGFSGVTITEDCETAFELHSKGWTSVFVDKPLIAGLQPETFTSFIGQRSRWCQGMFQILILKNPALKKGLHFIQRVAYLSSMTFWFFPLPRLMFMLAPLIHIFFDIKIFVSNIDEAISYTLTYIVVNVMLQNYLYGTVRWPWVSELYEYVQGVFLSKAIVSVAMSPRKPTFNVTAKGLTLDNDHLSELSWPFFAIWGLLMAGGLTAAYRYMFEPGVTNLMLVVGLWNGFNLLIAGTALGAVAERKQADRHPRLGIDRRGVLRVDGVGYPVAVKNVSAGGCGLAFDGDPPRIEADKTRGVLTIEPAGHIISDHELKLVFKRQAETQEGVFGAEFEDMDARAYYALADLMYGDSDALPRFLASRRKHKNVFAGSFEFIRWGLFEPVRAFSYLFKKAPEAKVETTPEPTLPEIPTDLLKMMMETASKHLKDDATAKPVVDAPAKAS